MGMYVGTGRVYQNRLDRDRLRDVWGESSAASDNRPYCRRWARWRTEVDALTADGYEPIRVLCRAHTERVIKPNLLYAPGTTADGA